MENVISSKFLKSAAVLMALTCGVHIFAGGPELYAPLRASDGDPVFTSVFSVVWHFVTLQLALMALGLWHLSIHPNPALFWGLWMSLAGTGALFVGYGLNDLHSLWPMPQWIAFWGVAALMLPGARRT